MDRGEATWPTVPSGATGSEADKRRLAVIVRVDGANLTATRLGRGVEPGRYAFTDFVKVGVPLVLLTLVVCVVLIPLLFPFT